MSTKLRILELNKKKQYAKLNENDKHDLINTVMELQRENKKLKFEIKKLENKIKYEQKMAELNKKYNIKNLELELALELERSKNED